MDDEHDAVDARSRDAFAEDVGGGGDALAGRRERVDARARVGRGESRDCIAEPAADLAALLERRDNRRRMRVAPEREEDGAGRGAGEEGAAVHGGTVASRGGPSLGRSFAGGVRVGVGRQASSPAFTNESGLHRYRVAT